MSAAKEKIRIEEALTLAYELYMLLEPQCRKLEIAGSVRRSEVVCGDIEIVCLPRFKAVDGGKDLFGNATPEYINQVIDWIDNNSEANRIKGGDRYQKITYKGVQVDIFMPIEEEFGRIFAIRTGPASYAKKMGARWKQLGYKGIDGRLLHQESGKQAGPFLTEKSFFDFIGWPMPKPEARI